MSHVIISLHGETAAQIEPGYRAALDAMSPCFSSNQLARAMPNLRAGHPARKVVDRPTVVFDLDNPRTGRKEIVVGGDSRHRQLLDMICDSCEPLFTQTTIGADGVAQGYGATRSFHEARAIPGLLQTPQGRPDLIRFLDRKVVQTKLFRTIFEYVIDKFYANYEPQSGRQKKISAFGDPENTNVVQRKHELTMMAVAHGHAMYNSLAALEFDWWLDVYGGLPVTRLGSRTQNEKVRRFVHGTKPETKIRSIVTATGVRQDTDNGIDWLVEYLRKRYRVVFNVPQLPALSLQHVLSGFRTPALEHWAPMWKQRTAAEFVTRLRRFEGGIFQGWDASNYDANLHPDLMEPVVARNPLFTDRARQSALNMLRLPIVIQDDRMGHAGAYLVNTMETQLGLPSGHPHVDTLGKAPCTSMMMYAEALARGFHHSQFNISDVHRFCEDTGCGRDERWFLFNGGDDNETAHARVKDGRSFGEKLTGRVASELLAFDADVSAKFTGRMIRRDTLSQLFTSLDPVALVTRTLSPERAPWTKHRRMPITGHLARIQLYQNDNAYPCIEEAFERAFRTVLGVGWRDLLNATQPRELKVLEDQARELRALQTDLALGHLNEASLMTLLDPDAIHYKVDARDVDQRVLSLYYSAYSPAEVEAMALKLGTIAKGSL